MMFERIGYALLTGLSVAVLTGCPSEDSPDTPAVVTTRTGVDTDAHTDTDTDADADADADADTDTHADTDAHTDAHTDTDAGGMGPAQGVLSNDGTFYVTYAIDPDPLPLNEVYSMKIEVFDGEDRARRLDDVELSVDGRMPMHRHGMNREPQITRNEDGSFTVTGMLFHMPGDWVLHFDVTRHGITERAQVDIELE